MAETTGYQIGKEGSDVSLLWYPEAVYGTNPDGAITWNASRLISENFRGTKNRIRPPEIRNDWQVAGAITSQEPVTGSFVAPARKLAFTEILAASINADATTGTFNNTTEFKSFTFLKKFASDLYFAYTGSVPTAGRMEVQTGDFLRFGFDFVCKAESKVTSLTGTEGAVDTYEVFNPVSSVATLTWGGTSVSNATSVNLRWTKQNAQSLYSVGSAAASGFARGELMVMGDISLYFNDATYYDDFVAETTRALVLTVQDSGSAGYTFTLPQARIMNPSIVAGGPGPIIAQFELEAESNGTYTIQIAEV